ncbi:unnamed protein product [Effrenium voratum]|nr:unnamed protein product [Effrenium voratum]
MQWVGVSSKEAVNTMRSELLDLPDLLAVQPLPRSMNMVGWLSGSLAAVGTQVYRFSQAVHKAELKLDEKDKRPLTVMTDPTSPKRGSGERIRAQIVVSLEQDGKTLAECRA